jgi:hypothetical protein
MIGKLLYGACGAALVMATAVVAQPSQSGASADANKQICRNTADTGSRLGHTRSCHTAQEWTDLRRQTRQNIDRIQTRQAMNSDPAGG